jgi:hypothetical protein
MTFGGGAANITSAPSKHTVPAINIFRIKLSSWALRVVNVAAAVEFTAPA